MLTERNGAAALRTNRSDFIIDWGYFSLFRYRQCSSMNFNTCTGSVRSFVIVRIILVVTKRDFPLDFQGGACMASSWFCEYGRPRDHFAVLSKR